ncbi:tol-pal system protein YbgF [Consotaella salsifontis]|uniref:Cell division coordinator CpoB n=1 Tax=Consotaella salsifontis TaxID=1365950 RepID=A0A1T4RED0_9HYPH|nr:tol-pal system protein YbgF [Consotaella salsifontis]SKA14390.1 tol-pal system protein YbgF [Consotaella salsifontis]
MVHRLKARTSAGLASVAAVLLLLSAGEAGAFSIPFHIGSSQGDREAGLASASAPADNRSAQVLPVQSQPVRVAQASDTLVRLNQLEDEVRRLNGRVEELSYQLLQAQEQMRKQQEDNEFRFQDLEGRGGGAGASASGQKSGALEKPQPTQGSGDAEFAGLTPEPGAAPAGQGADTTGNVRQIPDSGSTQAAAPGQGTGTPAPAATPTPPTTSSETVASIDPKSAGDLYALAYNYLLAGDYKLAENAFRQYSQTYPDAKDAADAEYWLGESLFAQKEYTDAAEVFLNAQKQHPDSRKAPEMLLKLGMSLARLDNADTACATYNEVSRRYPNVSDSVRRKLKDEKTAARCSQRG